MSAPLGIITAKGAVEENVHGKWIRGYNGSGADLAAGDVVTLSEVSGSEPTKLLAVADNTNVQIVGVVDNEMASRSTGATADMTPRGKIKDGESGWVKIKGDIVADTKAALNPTAGHGCKVHDALIDTLGAAVAYGANEIGYFLDTGAANTHAIRLHGLGPKTAPT